jgi:hypothetical protein
MCLLWKQKTMLEHKATVYTELKYEGL